MWLHIRNKGESGTVKHVLAPSNYLTDRQGSASFENLFLFMFCVCHTVFTVHCSLVVTCCERADLLTLLYVVFLLFVTFPYAVQGQV